MAFDGLLVTALFMLVLVAPLLGITAYSIRSDHHSPSILQEVEQEIERELEE